jgi:hypothetical protein
MQIKEFLHSSTHSLSSYKKLNFSFQDNSNLCEFFLASLVVGIVVKVLAWAGNAEWVRTALASVRAV